jgi:hypothetical protein
MRLVSRSKVTGLQEVIAAMMSGGASLDTVEERVIEPSALEPDQKSALWLYAWSFTDQLEQRRQATKYLMAVSPA